MNSWSACGRASAKSSAVLASLLVVLVLCSECRLNRDEVFHVLVEDIRCRCAGLYRQEGKSTQREELRVLHRGLWRLFWSLCLLANIPCRPWAFSLLEDIQTQYEEVFHWFAFSPLRGFLTPHFCPFEARSAPFGAHFSPFEAHFVPFEAHFSPSEAWNLQLSLLLVYPDFLEFHCCLVCSLWCKLHLQAEPCRIFHKPRTSLLAHLLNTCHTFGIFHIFLVFCCISFECRIAHRGRWGIRACFAVLLDFERFLCWRETFHTPDYLAQLWGAHFRCWVYPKWRS